MKSTIYPRFNSKKITYLVLFGSLGVVLALTALLVIYDICSFGVLKTRAYIAVIAILYLSLDYYFLHKKHVKTANWMLIILYAGLAFATLLYWGLNSGIGIFAIGFVIILSGILLGSRSILPVAISVIFLLSLVQFIHSVGLIKPDLTSISEESSFLDVISYATILSIFALIAWISNSQMEKSLMRAYQAERAVKAQKGIIAKELEKESFRLRQVQLKEIQQLYKFATLGQSTAATLHELSNHLSILNLDIDDLKQHLKNSKAIENAKDGIEQINLMVRQVRKKLESHTTSKTFNALPSIHRVVKDLREKFHQKNVQLTYIHEGENTFFIKGDPFALMQVTTILLSNALDACYSSIDSHVTIRTKADTTELIISIKDNGIGVSQKVKRHLFSPTLSSKPSGLGVGLYIAKHLTESQFGGSIRLESKTPKRQGAEFIVSIPKKNN